MLLNIFSYGRVLASITCDKVSIPAKSGELEINSSHCPYSTLLSCGKVIACIKGGKSSLYQISGGLAVIKDDEVNILANLAGDDSKQQESSSIKATEKFLQKNPALEHLADRLQERQTYIKSLSTQQKT